MHPACLPEPALLAQCVVGRGRSSGPGGQHRNKVETKALIEHLPTGIAAHASERRSPEMNRREAIFRLRLSLAVHVRTSPVPRDRWGDIRSDLWRSRCGRDGIIRCNPAHDDFPAMLAEALDAAAASGFDLKTAALRLCCSMSQLLKLIKDHPPALEQLNRDRAERSLRPLK